MKKQRLCGLDIVRTFAIMSVIILHAISSKIPLAAPLDKTEVFFLYMRNITTASVPLFIMLTGYLQRNKGFTAAHYRALIPLCTSYAAIGAICLIYSGKPLAIGISLLKLLNFSANGYAWYFEMYIGLFLLIPFLNMIYGSIKTKRGKIILISTLAFLTLMHDTVIGFSPYYDGTGNTLSLHISPTFFKSLYPFTYYFLGAFISEYKPKLTVLNRIILTIAAPVIPTVIITLFSNIRNGYAWYLLNGFQTLTVCITAIAIFLAFYDIDIKAKAITLPLAVVSTASFEIYLFSYLYDTVVYTNTDFAKTHNIVIVILAVFAASFASAILLKLLLKTVNKGLSWIYDKATKSSKDEL